MTNTAHEALERIDEWIADARKENGNEERSVAERREWLCRLRSFESCKNLFEHIMATPSPAPGLVEAAEWHRKKADDYAEQHARARKDSGSPAGLILGTLGILEEEHREAEAYFFARATGGAKE